MNALWEFLKSIPQVAQLLLVAALVFLVTNVLTGRDAKTTLETYIEEYRVFQEKTKQTVKMLDSVTALVRRQDVEIAGHMKKADSYRAENARLLRNLPTPQAIASLRFKIDSLKAATGDSVELARTVIPAQEALIQIQDSTITVYRLSQFTMRGENLSLRAANIVLVSENMTLKTALDSARTNLVNIPDAPRNPDKFFFGLFNKPTRTQSLVIGFIGGTLTAVAINNYVR